MRHPIIDSYLVARPTPSAAESVRIPHSRVRPASAFRVTCTKSPAHDPTHSGSPTHRLAAACSLNTSSPCGCRFAHTPCSIPIPELDEPSSAGQSSVLPVHPLDLRAVALSRDGAASATTSPHESIIAHKPHVHLCPFSDSIRSLFSSTDIPKCLRWRRLQEM